MTAPSSPADGLRTAGTSGVALVTGAARRIGRAIALGLAADGFAVCVHYRNSKADAEAVCGEIAACGGSAVPLRADLGDEAACARLLSDAAEALGPVTCLVNNASVFERDDIDSVTAASWQQHIDTNLRAPLLLSQGLAHRLPHGAEGNIVNIVDQRVLNLPPDFLSYTVSKDGLWTLTQTLALALAPRIRVNAIGPGPTLPSPRQDAAQFAVQAGRMPLGRGATPQEIAEGVRFVIASGALTGQLIALDGGQHLGWDFPSGDGEEVVE